MKILYLITRAERGGAQMHVLDLLTNLPSGCRPILATGESGYLADEARDRGIQLHHIHHLRQPMSPIHDLLALGEIAALVKAESPDLIHAHTSKAGLLGRIAGWFTGTPTLFTAHTWSFADGISPMQRRIAIPLERLAASMGGKVITVSLANEKMAARESITSKGNLATIWNGIPDLDLRAEPGTHDIPTVVMVARFAPQKDQLTLLRALSGVQMPWRLTFVGDGPTRRDVELEAQSLSVVDRVQFLGDRSDISELLAKADIFVLATKWEGLPLSILEAMRAGLPVISSDVGGCSEAVVDGVTGFLIPPSDVDQLRAKLQLLLSSKPLQKTLGEAGRERFHQEFRIESMMEKLLAVYHEAIPHGELERTAGALRLNHPSERLVE